MLLTAQSPPGRKIALFRSLFRGGEEVYPRRFESRKTGRAGYQPVCGNEWIRGICEKPRIKCSDCPHQRWLPVTDEVVHWHLSGEDGHHLPFVMGVYPMMVDEKCWFPAADFDRADWQQDALAFLETCTLRAIPSALERSRSGHGGHVWIFFEEAIPATLARKLGAYLLTETMERRPEIGFASYDRFFPNQDTLPKGGFGNLIALPLQKNAREQGNSVFVDETLTPWPDPWVFLSSQPRVPTARLESIVQEATAQGRITGVRSAHPDDEAAPEPWKPTPSRRRAPALTGPMPRVIPLVLGDALYLPKTNLPPSLRNALLRLAAFQNPEFYKAQAMRRPTFDKRRIISCAEDHAAHLALPRGCLEETLEFLKTAGIKTILEDVRCQGKPLAVTFQGLLRDDQQAAAAAMRPHDTGVLAATTAFGKTVLAAWLIAQRGVNTLVLVHRQQLLDQWLERLSQFPGLNPKDVGRLGGGKKKLTGALDVALIQSLVRDGIDPPLAQLFVHATRPPAPDAEGFARARSASKTFLHRRLETHLRLAGHFQLNAGLPIPFNDHSEMEVDFLCAPARLVIELDGPQHLTDPAAYRRDRRKDALLQMNGYFVLRFLTDELSKDLDHVIDQILRVLATRKR